MPAMNSKIVNKYIVYPGVMIILLLSYAELTAQTLEMKIKIPAMFNLQWLPENHSLRSVNNDTGHPGAAMHWLEITGDENVEIMVRVNQDNDSLRACYINSGVFDANDAVPFPGSRAAFVLNSTAPNLNSPACFRAWIGICDAGKCLLTFEYP